VSLGAIGWLTATRRDTGARLVVAIVAAAVLGGFAWVSALFAFSLCAT
jgi:hypothetical protein